MGVEKGGSACEKISCIMMSINHLYNIHVGGMERTPQSTSDTCTDKKSVKVHIAKVFAY